MGFEFATAGWFNLGDDTIKNLFTPNDVSSASVVLDAICSADVNQQRNYWESRANREDGYGDRNAAEASRRRIP